MYQALYRKWRPRTFEDVLSQPQVTITLKNQVRANTTAHAYLFTGSRGTGKTTCARILAKSVNCLHPRPDGSPCLECEICIEAEKGILSDIVEIDAASNNSVDDVRDLRDTAVYTPEKCKYKIYIIDEVHMLSTSAFNALLKIMEEPPAYVMFILATTEIHKVPATIISRCQRYDFRRIQLKDLVARLEYIAQQEHISLDRQAAEQIAKLSDGGMRDAISLLDRCAAYGGTITAQRTAEAAGVTGRDILLQMIQELYHKNISKVLEYIAQQHDASKDLQRLCEELIVLQRDVMLLKATGDLHLLHCMQEEIPALQEIAAAQDMSLIMQMLDMLQSCREHMARAVNKRVELEMTCIRICNAFSQRAVPFHEKPSEQPPADVQKLLERLDKLEKAQPVAGHPLTKPQPSPVPEPKPEFDMHTVKMSDFQPLVQWTEILEVCSQSNPALSGTLAGSHALVYANMILITAENPFFLTMFKRKENAASLNDAIMQVMGRRYAVRAKCSQDAVKPQTVEEMLERAKSSGIPTTAVT